LRVKNGVRESRSRREVAGVPFQVGAVLLEGHLMRPPAVDETRRGMDVRHAGRPGRIVRVGVLRSQRLEAEPVRERTARRAAGVGYEGWGICHEAMLLNYH